MRDRVELRHLPCRVLDDVADDPHRRRRRIDVGVADHELLEDVVLDGPRELALRHALLLGRDDVAGEHRQHRAVHRHRHADLVERNAVEQDLHVLDRVDRHARLADVARHARVVAVVAAVRGEVERDRHALPAAGERLAVEGIALLGGRKARVLADRPRPHRVHRRLRPAHVRREARQRVGVGQPGGVGRGVQRPDGNALGRDPVQRRHIAVEATTWPPRGTIAPAWGGSGSRGDSALIDLLLGLAPSPQLCIIMNAEAMSHPAHGMPHRVSSMTALDPASSGRSRGAPSTRRWPTACASRSSAARSSPANWIDEMKLSREYGISRTPLREALKVLAVEGLVTMKLGRGAYVTEMSERDVTDIYHLLGLLESDAVAAVARQASDAQIAELEALHAELEGALGNRARFFRLNEAFHLRDPRDRRQPLAQPDRGRPAQGDEAQPPPLAVPPGAARGVAGRASRADVGAQAPRRAGRRGAERAALSARPRRRRSAPPCGSQAARAEERYALTCLVPAAASAAVRVKRASRSEPPCAPWRR